MGWSWLFIAWEVDPPGKVNILEPNKDRGVRIPAYRLVECIVQAMALRYGCTEEEANSIHAGPSGPGLQPCLASVRAGDGREVYRFGSIKELDAMVRCEATCQYIAKAVRIAFGNARFAPARR